jgi:type IV pilus assembly protein PilY1
MKTRFVSVGAAALLLLSQSSLGVTVNSASLNSGSFTMQPPVLTSSETPLVMLGLSVDNQLFYKAYTDYSDIDSDGQLDTSYVDTFDYYGYFDSNWCYTYDATDDAFEPDALADVEADDDSNQHICSGSSQWSGNFLNWSTMTRVDVLRRVLYGGLRSTDTASSTVLERAYIPSDVHAFAKVYDGSDIANFTPYTPGELTDGALTLCNVSSLHPYSSTSEPQLRLAEGNYRRWSVNESRQCQWDSGANRPDTADQLNNGSEIVVRVKACVASKDDDSESCRSYGSDAKPAGLLQQYGESGDLKFGLISGGYENYIAGGRLRKNIGLIGSNADPDDDEVNLTDGTFNDVDGIISTVDAINIIGWSGSGYGCGGPGISISNFKDKSNACRDWGNPIAEIYAEAVRYFSGATAATGAFSSGNDSDHIAALKDATWPSSLSANPLNTDTRCAACSIIMISSGVASFDGDDLSSVDDIEGLSSVSDLSAETNAVGSAEYGTFPANFLVGETTASDDLICTSKSVSGLSVALGICPEAPALEGSYQIAGLASHAKTTDLREDTGMDGDQTIDTYGVELAESVPSFEIPVGSGVIRFLPACQSSSDGVDWIPCSLFDVEVLATETDSSGNLISGTLMFHWEDSSWGSDYDLDGSQVIRFCVGGSSSDCDDANNDDRTDAGYDDVSVADGRLRIAQGVAYTAAGFDIRFGYVVTGSNDDGISDWLLRPGGENRNDLCQLDQEGVDGNPLMPIPTSSGSSLAGCGEVGSNYDYKPESEIFQSGATAGGRLIDKPLLLAAKYGGFADKDGSGDPIYQGSATDAREWDLVNNRTGEAGSDGVPDNYFFSSNPGLLANQLQRIFEALVARTASGTNAAVVANSSSGVGAVYQALYQPQNTVGTNTVNWTGTLRAIFIDEQGRLREDSNSNAQLDDYSTDKVVQLEFDPSVEKTFVQRYAPDASGDLVPEGTPVELTELIPIWSAVERLAEADNAENQRGSYLSGDLTTRYILTAMDRNADNEVDAQDVVDFTSSGMAASYSDYHEYFGLPAAADVGTLIDFLRGKEVAGARNRTIDFDNDGDDEVWRLGDIIHSTPAVVATPTDNYNRLYGDTTYENFVDEYVDRRQVIYVGSNGGMIHAFNGGFWDAGDKKFQTTSAGKTTRPLGQEMWAYVPSNLLPHMRWLAEPDYQHVYYMDGEPIVFDANVFPDDSTHIDGWGTIMVMGMRFGGSPLQIEVDSENVVMRSAYVFFDVTDPEQPPKLLGEVTAPELGYTLSRPAVVKHRVPSVATGDWSNPSFNDWYLVLGSGPRGADAISDAVSDQTARLFAIDLETLVDNAGTATSTGSSYFTTIGGGNPLDLGGLDGYLGGMEAVDWDRNGSEDALYVSTIEGVASSPSGRMHRLLIEDNDGSVQAYNGLGGASVNEFMNPGLPIQAAPTTVRDSLGARWLLFGTGKLLVPGDNALDQQEYFYGVKEPRGPSGDLTYADVDDNNLIDTTAVAVFEESGEVKDISSGSTGELSIGGNAVTTFGDLEDTIRDYPGWKIQMTNTGGMASGRVTNKATLNPANRESFGFTEYLPPAQSCELDGESFLYALSILTGTATPDAPLSTSNEYIVNTKEMSQSVLSLGPGYASSITFHQGTTGNVNAITNMSTGAINTTQQAVATPVSGRQSWRQIESLSF